MSIIVNCKGLQTPGGDEDRDIAYLDVQYKGSTYDWLIYVPLGVNLGQYISDMTPSIQADIDAKEAAWTALNPKTKTVQDFMTMQNKVVPIEKNEIVKPDYPDYYAKRRSEYPPLRDQIGALVNPTSTPSLADIKNKIQEIKNKYPKPPVV